MPENAGARSGPIPQGQWYPSLERKNPLNGRRDAITHGRALPGRSQD